MAGPRKPQVTAKDMVDLAIAVLPIALLFAFQYRDEIKRAQMWAEGLLTRRRDREAELLAQVQREISLMEHGGLDAD
jgi:hypothetical protein